MTVLNDSDRWVDIYNQISLNEVPRHFASLNQSRFLTEYLSTVLHQCPRGGSSCETGIGSGYGAIWLSLRGVNAEGIDNAPTIVERARHINTMLGGHATFREGDLFNLYKKIYNQNRYDVIHHQGVLEHFTVPQIHAALAQQVASCKHVVFSVPSVYYPFDGEFGDERFLPLEEWERILSPFDVIDLKYYGDPQHGEREHILCVLKGQEVNVELEQLMTVPSEPYPQGISAIVHTRNEAHHIKECLQTLQGWTDEIILCDMESGDETVEKARQFTENIISHPFISNFDRARNVSAMRAQYRWIFYLDADERVPPALGTALRQMAVKEESTFEALLIPFRHHFSGHWMRSLYPGYTMPRLFKNGCFSFNSRLHAGAQVNGRTVCFPANDPALALVHYSYDDIHHYITKMNRYTDGEAANLQRDGASFQWQQAIRHWVQDMHSYYDVQRAHQDGPHGLIYSWMSGYYRFIQHAKLYEKHFHAGQVAPAETAVPATVEEMLEYALSILREKPVPQMEPIRIRNLQEAEDVAAKEPANHSLPPVVWSGPLHNLSGYGEESRHFLLGMEETGIEVAGQVIPWSNNENKDPVPERERINALAQKTVPPNFIHIIEDFPQNFTRHPQAKISIGRTMFETDRLPASWVNACNKMDYIWVPSEFNRATFTAAGIEENKIVVIPGCFDTRPFKELKPRLATRKITSSKPFCFISLFDWTLHKGWDILLKAFLEAFDNRKDITLALKVWSTMGYSMETIKRQAEEYISEHTSCASLKDAPIEWVEDKLSSAELLQFYTEADAFVLPSRGEGWGRPYMEAMACGLPVIGTDWSGNTAFMKSDNSYLIDYQVQPVPQKGWNEIPTYRGHQWAEPDATHLMQLMQRIVENQEEAHATAQKGREHVLENYDRKKVAVQIQEELERITDKNSASKSTSKHTAKKPTKKSVRICWEGAQFSQHSLGLVNREITSRLLDDPTLEISLSPTESAWFDPMQTARDAALQRRIFAPLSGETDVTIRHFYPPRFEPPAHGKFVLMQPWEYGYLPTAWIEPIRQHVDEVWCYSNYVRDVYTASGIAEEKLHVIPLGVNTQVFHPNALPHIFTQESGTAALSRRKKKPFTFLFVGGTLHRKGIDLLLNAYFKAFTALDEVCLVIKDTGTDTVYRGGNERENILRMIEDNNGNTSKPAMVYLNDDLSEHQLAGLFTASDCLVQPYRGEGFCLPALEAMACGLPVVVPQGGPTDDFVDDETAWRLEAKRQPFGILPGQSYGRVGQWDCAGPTWQWEIDEDDLARQLRYIFFHQEEAAQRGEAAAKKALSFTWEHTAEAMEQRLHHLAATKSSAKDKNKKATNKYFSSTSLAEEPRKTPTISLCMIVRDEERVFDDCLKSVKPWVDEIIVVDTGSTDRTVEIAKEHDAHVYHFPWCDDFSAARNVSIEHATSDWIFWMDADDTIPESCGKQLHALIEQAEDRTTGYMMQVHIPPAPGENGFTIVDHVKLFRNLPQLRFLGRIHEQILEPIHSLGGRVERTDLYVVHSGYDYSEAGQQKKRARDLSLLEQDLADRPGHPFVLFNIGMTAHHMKEWDKAIDALSQSLKHSKPFESTVRKAYAMLAGSYLGKGDVQNAAQQIQAGLGLFPHDPELLFRAGIIYEQAGDLAKSEQAYLTLLTNRETGHIDSLDVSMTTYKAHHNLGALYQRMARHADAEKQFRAAIQSNPQFAPSWLGLSETLRALGKHAEALEARQQLEKAENKQ